MIFAAALTELSPRAIWREYGGAVVDGAFNVLMALGLLLLGLWLTGWVSGAVRRIAGRHEQIDATLAAFFASIARYVLMALVLIAVLDRFGVQTTQIVAVLGAATLAIGLSLQGALSNVAAGVMLILFRPYRLGDFVELAGRRGVVQDVNIFITRLATPDNVAVILPNGQCWGAPILNFSTLGARMVEWTFHIAFDADVDRALKAVNEALAANPRVLDSPAPAASITALGAQSVTLGASAWCAAGDFVALRNEVTKAVKLAFDAAGVAFPPVAPATR